MDSLVFTVYPDKSCLIPTQILTYLGFVLNSLNMTVALTDDKKVKIRDLCLQFVHGESYTIRECSAILGALVAAEPGVDHAPLHYKRMEHGKIEHLKFSKGNFEAQMPVTPQAREDMTWWIEHVHTSQKQIYRGPPSIQIFSDSSDFAWGGRG